MSPGSDRRRCFVLTVGRSGSSLLCATMAGAGADFGLPAPTLADPDRGELEHPAMIAAAREYRRALDALHGGFLLSPRLEAAWRRRRGRRLLRRALALARYFKIGDLDLVVQPAFKLGWEPRVVLSYRRFDATVASLVAGRTYAGPDALAADYVRVYRQGLALMDTFGGCVVGYEDLIGDAAVALRALAAVTGLDVARLEAARDRFLRRTEVPQAPRRLPYPEVEAVYECLQARRGEPVLEPSAPVRRRLARRGLSDAGSLLPGP